MIKAIQVLRIHLLELEKVNELCLDFCSRYIASIKTKLNSHTLLKGDDSDSDDDYDIGMNLMLLETNSIGRGQLPLLEHVNADAYVSTYSCSQIAVV